MVIVSIKGHEKHPSEWVVKARIVFRGDAVRDEDNQAAVFDEIAASAPTSLARLNLVSAYGLLDGNQTTTSDCVRAYVQSVLSSSQPPFVLLPSELIPPHARHIGQPCASLVTSSHLLASASWQNYLAKVLSKQLGGTEFEKLPSCCHFPRYGLSMAVYVDDLTLSGPKRNHNEFWSVLRKHVQLEDPAPLAKVLGRGHVSIGDGLALHSNDFARQCVALYEELSGKSIKLAKAPHVDEGSLVSEDDVDKGQLSNAAARLVYAVRAHQQT